MVLRKQFFNNKVSIKQGRIARFKGDWPFLLLAQPCGHAFKTSNCLLYGYAQYSKSPVFYGSV